MNTQQFTGDNMRDVLAQVRGALGDDALIVETNESDGRFKVVAVSEHHSSEFVESFDEMESNRPLATPQINAESERQKIDVEQIETQRAMTAAAEKLAKISDVGVVREEMQSIRAMFESHLARVGWSEATITSPIKASIMRNLSAIGVTPDVVKKLVESIEVTGATGKTWSVPMQALMDALPILDTDVEDLTGVVAAVGPSGAGKTTTIAKLAARHVIKRGADSLAIVSLDNHRLGASEQIDAFARLIGVPVFRPVGDRGLDDVRELLADKSLVLVDTVGMGPYDERLTEQLGRLRSELKNLRSLLVLPANLEHYAMQEVVNVYNSCGLSGIILSKVDEAATLGAALSVTIRSNVPLAFVTDGQRIPEDIAAAGQRKIWLVKHAIELMRTREVSVSERYMAENFSGPELQGVS